MSSEVAKKVSRKFVDRLNVLLDEHPDFTQGMIGDKIGVTQEQISRWKTGKDGIGAENLFNLARFFKVNPEWLIGFSDSRGPTLLGEPVQYYKDIKESLERQVHGLYELVDKHEMEKESIRDTERQQIMIRNELRELVRIQNEKLKMLGI